MHGESVQKLPKLEKLLFASFLILISRKLKRLFLTDSALHFLEIDAIDDINLVSFQKYDNRGGSGREDLDWE